MVMVNITRCYAEPTTAKRKDFTRAISGHRVLVKRSHIIIIVIIIIIIVIIAIYFHYFICAIVLSFLL